MLRLLLLSFVILFMSVVYAEPVNINVASAVELAENLKGVGPKKAMAIIEYREANGPFYAAEELANVKGIGPKTLEKNKEDILVR
ncbi:MAG: helix-hairpin-helix domain-containing protein [Gammaproteobacteria bacterium]|nr:MAG: helix-hairpin-helix domain-containing protein [Gammaproteobacteria bacterium]